MNDLKSTLSILLIDTIKAQHSANKYSASLAEEYDAKDKNGNDVTLSFFNIPNSVFKEIEVDLKIDPIDLVKGLSENNSELMHLFIEKLTDSLEGFIGIPIFNDMKDTKKNKLYSKYIHVFKELLKQGSNKIQFISKATEDIYQELILIIQEKVSSNSKKKHQKLKKSNFYVESEYHLRELENTSRIKEIISAHLRQFLTTIQEEKDRMNSLIVNYKIDPTQNTSDTLWNIKLKIDMREFNWNEGEKKKDGTKDKYLLAI